MLMFLITIFSITPMYPHLILSLMSLEIIMMNMILFAFYLMMLLKMEYFIMILLTMIVCESVLGLTLLILMIHFKGKDNTNSLNLNF
uniref:NADH-ubiquinone oxidoreductase chain 4L n=1 Tax=Leptopilina boulardi TaxID=63433 RepID=A0A1L3MYD8_9HYME|nr:NADH dehydrogenase subunit 4L [Leptopilina boulardi]